MASCDPSGSEGSDSSPRANSVSVSLLCKAGSDATLWRWVHGFGGSIVIAVCGLRL